MVGGVVTAVALMWLVPAAAEDLALQVGELSCISLGALGLGAIPMCSCKTLFRVMCVADEAKCAGQP